MFVKKDESFICVNCNKKVEKLHYTSRDHCNYCLHSIHIDITPGDRLNECKGLLVPINVLQDSKKCGNILIVVGPEGGFSNNEVDFLSNNAFLSTTLGSNILRAETVPLFVLSVINYEFMR